MSGMWVVPGGHLEPGETTLEAAEREWREEVGLTLPAGNFAGTWTTSDGNYQAYVYRIPHESDIDLSKITNRDTVEIANAAWWAPADIMGNPAMGMEIQNADWSLLKAAKSDWAKHPIRKYQDALVAHYAPLIATALKNGTTGISRAVAQALSAKKATSDDIGGAAASDNISISPSEVAAILRNLMADAYLVGSHVAAEQVGGGAKVVQSLESAASAISWDDWEPGNVTAANLVADGGLQDLLDRAGITINSVIDNDIDHLGNVLAEGIARGDSADALAGSISDAVSSNAYMIADTECARAVSSASQATYAANGVEQWEWIAQDSACPACLDNESSSPYDVGDGPDIPEHPICRCSSTPAAYSSPSDSEG